MNIYVINGPNLDRLGNRDTRIYGPESLQDLQDILTKAFPKVNLIFFQSNSEGDIIDKIHEAADGATAGIVINPGAYAHYSYAIADALEEVMDYIPAVEVHISNIHAREQFRHTTVTGANTMGIISGLGLFGYKYAIQFIIDFLNKYDRDETVGDPDLDLPF